MTVTMYGSNKTLQFDRSKRGNRATGFGTQPFQFLAVPLRILVKYFLYIRIWSAPPRSFTREASLEPIADCDRCDLRVQHLKQTIELVIEEVARLICENRNALEATQFLNELTSELVAARLGICPMHNERGDSAFIDRTLERRIPERSGAYDPEQLSVLGRIFDEAVAALPEGMRTPENRTEIAKLIVGRAGTSELELHSLIKMIVAISSVV